MNYRYPGPQSFTEEDEQLFFGRNRETKALYDLIMVQPLVVLFAKSGMGKTSLLQAGIIPRLRFTEYDPLIFRLNDVALAPNSRCAQNSAHCGFRYYPLDRDHPLQPRTPGHPFIDF